MQIIKEDDIMRTIMGMMRMRMALTRLVQQFSSSNAIFSLLEVGKMPIYNHEK